MAEEPDAAAHRPGLGRQGVAEHDRLAPHRRDQPRQDAQQRGLACTVRTAEEDDLAAHHVQVDAGECGESPEQRDGGAEVDDRLHGTTRGY